MKWAPDFANALDAYVRFRSTPLFAYHQGKLCLAETTQQHIRCLIHGILRDTGLALSGELVVENLHITPEQNLCCEFELENAPAIKTASYQSELHLETTTPSSAPCTACDIPDQLMRLGIAPEDRAAACPGTPAWDDAAKNILLHTLVRNIASKQNITIDEPTVETHLQKLTQTAGTPEYEPHAARTKADLLQGAAEHLLVETVVARYGSQ